MKIAEILKLIAKHGLRDMDKMERETFAGIEGNGYICEPTRGTDDGEFLIVVGTDPDGAQIEAFGAEGEQIAMFTLQAA